MVCKYDTVKLEISNKLLPSVLEFDCVSASSSNSISSGFTVPNWDHNSRILPGDSLSRLIKRCRALSHIGTIVRYIFWSRIIHRDVKLLGRDLSVDRRNIYGTCSFNRLKLKNSKPPPWEPLWSALCSSRQLPCFILPVGIIWFLPLLLPRIMSREQQQCRRRFL